MVKTIMIHKRYRFSGPNSTRRVQAKGRTFRHGAFSLRCLATSRDESRLAVVVSKKVDKRAVVRNRIRRRVFESVRHQWRHLEHPVDMTIGIFSNDIATMDAEKLTFNLMQLFEEAGIVSKPKL